ncbi:butyrophilin subfamily 1 member A1-like isoform 6-T6 [Acanthopagrus schlegelii]
MLRVTLSRSLNFQFGAFTVLVVLHSCRGQHHVNCPSQPILATVGEDIILPAYLEPATNAKTIEWTRPDLSPRYVHVQRQGVKLTDNHPSYEGRTSLLSDELKLGNISLKLSRVRISDEGPYRCFLPEMKISCIIQLVVGAASSPDVQMTVVLQCNSTGWYPEPEVFWLDGEGNLLSAGPTETVRGPDDLYTVSSRVTVEKRHSNSFTCRVQQNHINQTREAHIHVPETKRSSKQPEFQVSGVTEEQTEVVSLTDEVKELTGEKKRSKEEPPKVQTKITEWEKRFNEEKEKKEKDVKKLQTEPGGVQEES